MEDIDKREADLLWIQNEKEESEAKDIERLKGYSSYVLFDEFVLPLPDEFGVPSEQYRKRRFFSKFRPELILCDETGEVNFTFQTIKKDPKDSQEAMKVAKEIMDLGERERVFYESGKRGQALWLDYKSFVGDEVLYGMFFLADGKEERLLGTFLCPFSLFDQWKPKVLKVLEQLEIISRTKEEEFEI